MLAQGLLLEGPAGAEDPAQLSITINFGHACLELHDARPGRAAAPCLRTVTSLEEALTALHGEAGPTPQASPIKASSGKLTSPAKPPLQPASSAGCGALEHLQRGVQLVQACMSAQLREGVALLSAAAGDPHLTAHCVVKLSAVEALVTAAATVLPDAGMGMTELLTTLVPAIKGLLDAAPPAVFAAGRLVEILSAMLQQKCANLALLCQLVVAVLHWPLVRAEAMQRGLATAVSSLYVGQSSDLQATARALMAPDAPAGLGAGGSGTSARAATSAGPPVGQPAPAVHLGDGHVARMVAAYNDISDSGSDCSPTSSKMSPTKVRHPPACCTPRGQRVHTSSGSVEPPLVMNCCRSQIWVQDSPGKSPPGLAAGRFKVPRLQLPSDDSPMNPVAGLTRSTRRVLSNTPGGRRSPTPTPWGSPTRQRGGSTDLGELSAVAQMAVVAGAVGESLIAADLPSIIAHKRQVEAAGSLGATEDVPAELLESPVVVAAPGTGRRKALEAHRILVTARSLRSLGSSTSRATDSEADAAAAARSARQAADAEQLKCLLLQALLLALPVMGPTGEADGNAAAAAGTFSRRLSCDMLLTLHAAELRACCWLAWSVAGYPAQDPGPVLAVEVLGLAGTRQPAEHRLLKQLALQALRRLSQRPGTDLAACHPLVTGAGARLQQTLGRGGSITEAASAEACRLLQLLTEYTAAAQAGSAAAAVMQHCLPGLQALLGMVMGTAGMEPSEWPTSCWQLFHGMVALLGPVCQLAEDAEAGRALLGLLLADRQAATLLANVGDLLFLEPEAARPAAEAYRGSTPALQRDLLQLFTSLAGVVGRLPPLTVQQQQQQEGDTSRAASRTSLLSISSGVDELAPTGDNPLADPGNDLLLGEPGLGAVSLPQPLAWAQQLLGVHGAGLARCTYRSSLMFFPPPT